MPESINAFIIDDEKNITTVLEAILRKAGYHCVAFNDGAEAMRALSERIARGQGPQVVITDLYMPAVGGMEVLESCRSLDPRLPVVFITAYGSVSAAVTALKQGAFDFITKPFEQRDLLKIVGHAIATFNERRAEPLRLLPHTAAQWDAVSASHHKKDRLLVGQSAAIQEISKIIEKVASSNAAILITGESGTGKELVAQEIHRHSTRAIQPWIKIHCAAIPGEQLDGELFGEGHAKPGRFELARGGTLFLDEIGEMPLATQGKLLQALTEDVRIISASRDPLESRVQSGGFRSDLYYRLNVIPIHIPALRERKQDLEPLVQYFLGRFNQKLGRKVTGITTGAVEMLKRYEWPGNIRQLENVLERMVLMAEGPILGERDLPEEMIHVQSHDSELGESTNFKETVRRQTQSLEKDLIARALEETHGNVTRAAAQLGISRKGLQLKLRELGLRRDSGEKPS